MIPNEIFYILGLQVFPLYLVIDNGWSCKVTIIIYYIYILKIIDSEYILTI